VQCLLAAAPLASYLLSEPHTRCERSGFCALCTLQAHARDSAAATAPPDASSASSSSEPPPEPPSLAPFVRNIRRLGAQFAPGRQEDAHDFVHALLDACHVAFLEPLGGEARFDAATGATSGVYHLFGGATRSAVRCGRCRGVSATHETFLTLPLEVSGRIGSVEEALAANFTGGEDLKGGNAYACDACGALTAARKWARVAAAPNVLVLALKRYTGGLFGKLNKRVTYGASLELGRFMARPLPAAASDADAASADASASAPRTPPAADAGGAGGVAPAAADAPAAAPAGAAEHASFSSASSSASASAQQQQPPPSASYRLFGVLVHLDWALSTSAGHYVCYVRRGGAWWKCDDGSVSASSETAALSQTAYMLFYEAAAPRPAPAVRPAWQEDSAEEVADAARRMAAAAAAAERAEAVAAATEVLPSHTLLSFGEQPAPATTRSGSAEPARTWPARLELCIQLPRVERAAELSDIVLDGQRFELRAPGKYRQISTLPFPVADTYEGTFDTDTRELRLKLDVVAMPREPPAAVAPPAPPPPPPPPPPVPAGARARPGAGGSSSAAAAAAAASARADATGASDSDDDDTSTPSTPSTSSSSSLSSGASDDAPALETHPLPKGVAGLRIASPPVRA
jgi:hypothetical protein